MASEEVCQFSSLALNSLRLTVRLGCSEQERQTPQFVRFDIRLSFPRLPSACQSDHLEETICFDKLSEVVKATCNKKEYHLIENLGWEIYRALKEITPTEIKLWVRTTKEKPPIAYLEGGASFSLGDGSEF